MPALKIGVVMDPIEKINIDKDTTFVLLLEAQQRNHEVYYMELDDLFIRGGTPYGRSRRVHVARRTPHYRLGEFKTGALEDFDVVLMRKDPPFDMKFFFSTHLLSLVDEQKCFVMNNPRGLREANEKLYALRFPEQIPQTLVTSDMQRLKEFMAELGGEMIIKPLDGCWRQRRVLPQPTRSQYQLDFGSSDEQWAKTCDGTALFAGDSAR